MGACFARNVDPQGTFEKGADVGLAGARRGSPGVPCSLMLTQLTHLSVICYIVEIQASHW